MHGQYPLYVVPLVVAAAISAAMALFAWRRRPASGAAPLALLLLAVAWWSLGYALQLGSGDLPSKLLWNRLSNVGIVIVPVAWLALVLQYTGREGWLTRRNVALLAIEPLVTLLLVWTNALHGLVYSGATLDTRGSFSMLDLAYGVWFWVDVAYSYLLILLGTLLLIQTFIRSARLYRRQVGALLVGTFIPWVAEVLSLSGLSPFYPLDLTPFAFTLSGLAVIWGLFRFRLLDIVPVARGAVIEGMSDGVMVLDVQNRIVDLNPAAQRIIGCSAAEGIGRLADRVLSGQPGLVARYRDATEAGEEVILGEGEAQHTYDLRISPLHDRWGRLTGRLIALREITERRRMEEALRESQEQLQAIVDNAPAVIFIRDTEGRYILINRGYEARFHITREEIVGKTPYDLFLPERAEALLGHDREVLEAGTPIEFEETVPQDDGLHTYIAGKFPLYDPAGVPYAVCSISTDITERQRTEEALRESQQLLERTFASLRDAVFIVDADTVEIVDCNPAASEIFGYSREEMLGCTTTFLHVDEVALEEFRGHLYPAVEEKGFLYLPEFRMKRKDGMVFPTEHSVVPLEDEQGQCIGWVSVVRDITERKRAEEALRQRTAQLEALREVGLELTAQLDLEALLHSIVSRAVELVGGVMGGLYLYRPERDVLEWTASVGPHAVPAGIILHRGEGFSGRVWEGGEPLIVDDYRDWEGQVAAWEDYPVVAVMGAPVRWGAAGGGGEFLGVLSVAADTPGAFSPSDAELLGLFASQAAVAIENARLYEEVEQRAEELRATYEQLQRAQEALVKTERLAAMSQVAVTVRHEINNPLTAVLGNAQWLLAVDRTLSSESREVVEEIERAAIRIRDVVAKLDEIEDRPVPYLGETLMIDIHGDREP